MDPNESWTEEMKYPHVTTWAKVYSPSYFVVNYFLFKETTYEISRFELIWFNRLQKSNVADFRYTNSWSEQKLTWLKLHVRFLGKVLVQFLVTYHGRLLPTGRVPHVRFDAKRFRSYKRALINKQVNKVNQSNNHTQQIIRRNILFSQTYFYSCQIHFYRTKTRYFIPEISGSPAGLPAIVTEVFHAFFLLLMQGQYLQRAHDSLLPKLYMYNIHVHIPS